MGFFDTFQIVCFHRKQIRKRHTRIVLEEQKTKAIHHQGVFWPSRRVMNFFFPKALKMRGVRSKTMQVRALSGPNVYEVGDDLGILNIHNRDIFLPFSSAFTKISSVFIQCFKLHYIQIIIINSFLPNTLQFLSSNRTTTPNVTPLMDNIQKSFLFLHTFSSFYITILYITQFKNVFGDLQSSLPFKNMLRRVFCH